MQSAEMQIGGWLPEEPVYPNAHDLESGRVIESRDPYDLPVARLREPPSEKTIQSILEGKTYIWVYGYVFYRDFLNDPHMLRFCAHWYIYNGPFLIPPRFIEDGPPKYTESY
jgi:hypothetical protein